MIGIGEAWLVHALQDKGPRLLTEPFLRVIMFRIPIQCLSAHMARFPQCLFEVLIRFTAIKQHKQLRDAQEPAGKEG